MIVLVNPIKVELEPMKGSFNAPYVAVKDKDEEIGRIFFLGVNRLSLYDERTNLVYELEITTDNIPMLVEMLLNYANMTLGEK